MKSVSLGNRLAYKRHTSVALKRERLPSQVLVWYVWMSCVVLRFHPERLFACTLARGQPRASIGPYPSRLAFMQE